MDSRPFSSSKARSRIGLVGMGYIGRYVYDQIIAHPEWGLDVAFVCASSARRLGDIPEELVLPDLADFQTRKPDLVVEMAHPQVSVEHGRDILGSCDYMPLSMTALASAELQQAFVQAARDHGTRLFIPHGAVVGLEGIYENRDGWDQVTIVMRKNPGNLDFSHCTGLKPDSGQPSRILYDGPTRGICPLFPKNVNSHATVALAGIGFDRTRSVLVADPDLQVSVIELEARGRGVELKVTRSNPLQGVSGVLTLRSAISAIRRAKGIGEVLEIC